MTIKRRLFISNNLMLVIPIIISLTIAGIIMSATMNILGINGKVESNEQFYHAVEQVRKHTEEWSQTGDIEQIKSDLNTMDTDLFNKNVFLSVYQNGKQHYTMGNAINNSYIESVLTQKGEHYFEMDQTGIYKTDAGTCTVLVVDTNLQNTNKRFWIYSDYYQYLINVGILMAAVIIVIILVTNRFLTRIVFKSIITPLDTLVYGVHQIRDGNLSYRIVYGGKDEFAAVCADFNEMAHRLMDMVNARQKDDENRRELIAGISHDLRTPLTSIKTYVEGIELGMASTPQVQKRYLNTIKNKTKDLEHIISQLFMFSKLDIGEFPLQMETQDIGKWLSDFVKGVLDEYGQKGLEIILVQNIRNTVVHIDAVQLRNVLINIFENSLKYGSQEQGIMKVLCQKNSTDVMITLTDNGPGVPEDALDNLFGIFYRCDKARSNSSQGSGLGLAISAKIIELLGGSITASNAPEGGLAITLTLPIVKGDHKNDKYIDH